MSEDWLNQVVVEVKAFLDQFEDNEIVAVYRDSDIIAALIGVFDLVGIVICLGRETDRLIATLNLLDSGPLGGSPARS